jgi:HEPN domain-containing protein
MGENELLQQWLDKANDDLRAAEYLSTMHHPTPDEIICYHCQQSAEKYLKGFLFLHDIEPPKTHDLNELLNMCVNLHNSLSVLLPNLSILKTYAVMPRYPNELGITGEDMKSAIRCAKEVQKFVVNVIDEILKNEENGSPA